MVRFIIMGYCIESVATVFFLFLPVRRDKRAKKLHQTLFFLFFIDNQHTFGDNEKFFEKLLANRLEITKIAVPLHRF